MIVKEYNWNISGLYNQDPNKVGKEFEKIGNDISAEKIVERAKNKANILHNMFEWDDSIAGHKYRLSQAQRMICALKVNIISNEKPTKTVRAYVNIKKGNGYTNLEKVVKDVDQYQMLLDKAYKELLRIKKKYENLTEIQDLLADIH